MLKKYNFKMDNFLVIPGYEIEKSLGAGGMAHVYLAIQKSMGRRVALKIMSDTLGYDKVWAKRFIQEAQVIAQLSHPNIVPVFDVGEHDGKFFISMEYLDGGNLKQKMASGLSIAASIKIITGIATGLDFAGEKGFVHRDIKPDNIMFGPSGSPVILDFGIVKQKNTSNSNMTQTGMVVGTTAYMSPEQAQAKPLDERSDIYSLGVLFYEMITGNPPFHEDSDIATLMCHVNRPPPPLPDELATLQPIFDKALAKAPDERYSRAREMIEHLEELEGPIKAMFAQLQTKAQEGVNSDATVVMNSSHKKLPSTAFRTTPPPSHDDDEDLTRVLSSAKATIKDHSAESYARRAKRTRTVLTTTILIALAATGYVGYQQLYLVPKEKALAEQRLKEAELRRQNKINQLITQATKIQAETSLTNTQQADEVIALYHEVLKLDSENVDANNALTELANNYVILAKQAATLKKLGMAETFQNYAVQLNPQHPELSRLRTSIQAIRVEQLQSQLDNQLKQEKIDTLLELAKNDISAHGGFSESAFTQLSQILTINPGNEEAMSYMDKMRVGLEASIDNAISSANYTQAKTQLNNLAKYFPNSEQLTSLTSHLNRSSKKAQQTNRIQRLTTQVSQLQREKRTIPINDEMRGIYYKILDMAPSNTSAKRGLTETVNFDLDLAEKAIDDRDFKRAKRQIQQAEKHLPKLSRLAEVKQVLRKALKDSEQADKLLAEIRSHLNDLTEKQRRNNLNEAQQKFKKAQVLDPKHPQLNDALASLENAYIEEIGRVISTNDKSRIDTLFSDSTKTNWPSDRILKLKMSYQSQTKEKKKPKRPLGGGF